MKMIQTTIVVDAHGKGIIQLTPDIAPGSHQAVVVIDEPVTMPAQPTMADFPRHEIPWPFPEGFTFRREEMYGDEGR
jgi:hypothetical protein